MRYFILFFLFVVSLSAAAQQITYNIPEGMESNISKEDYKRLVDLAIPQVSKRYKIDLVKDGTIHLKQDQDMQAFNLDNLILKCVAVKNKGEWKDVIQLHFENMFSAIDEQKKIDPTKFETVKKYLSLRIYPSEMVKQRGGTDNLITRTDLEGTYTVLMLDLPGAFAPVQKAEFELWKATLEAVFQVAQQNTNNQKIEKVTQQFDIDGSKIEISFLGNEDYAASYALDLQNNSPELVGEWGCVLAIPNKGLVDICKVSRDKPVDFVKFIQQTKPVVKKYYEDHPQPISDQYFWYYKGKFTKIAVIEKADGGINVISPFGLTELMTEKK
jgi:hypothetical protein